MESCRPCPSRSASSDAGECARRLGLVSALIDSGCCGLRDPQASRRRCTRGVRGNGNNDRGVDAMAPRRAAALIRCITSLADQRARRQDPIVSVGYGRTDARMDASPLRLSADDQLLVAEHRRSSSSHEGRRMDKLKGKNREPLSRLGLRQGKRSDPGKRRRDVRLTVTHIAVPHPAPSSRRMAADPPGEARLGDPARLGRDESDRAESSGENWLPGDIIGVWWVGRRRGRDPAGRSGQGYIAAGFNAPGANTRRH